MFFVFGIYNTLFFMIYIYWDFKDANLLRVNLAGNYDLRTRCYRVRN